MGPRRPRLQGDRTVIDYGTARQDPANPLGRNSAVGDDAEDEQANEPENRLVEAILVPGVLGDAATETPGVGGSIASGVSSSVMILVLVLVAGVLGATVWPPSRLQPATARTSNGRERPRRVDSPTAEFFTASVDDDDDTNIVMDTLRVLGIVRRRVDRPVVGRRAYVRWWERLRARSCSAQSWWPSALRSLPSSVSPFSASASCWNAIS